MSPSRALPLLLLPLLLSCKDKEPVDSGTPPPPPVDLLILADDSLSMDEANAQLLFALDGLLADALARGIDLQVSMTTLHIDESAAGALIAGPVTPADGAQALMEGLLCEGSCWDREEVPSAEGYACGDDPQGVVSGEYLACTCGEEWWREECSGGTEEPLEAALYAFCRALEEPSTTCVGSGFGEDQIGSSAGLLREGAVPHVVVISDEGDISRRLEPGSEDVGLYLTAYEELFPGLVFSALGPPWSADGQVACNTTNAESWSAARLQAAAEGTGGVYGPIAERTDTSCALVDFSAFLSAVLDTME